MKHKVCARPAAMLTCGVELRANTPYLRIRQEGIRDLYGGPAFPNSEGLEVKEGYKGASLSLLPVGNVLWHLLTLTTTQA